MRRCLLCCLLATFLLGSAIAARVRPLESRPPIRTVPGLQFLTSRAGIIFSGTVLSVARVSASRPNEIETMEVRFQVEEPVRGVRAGQQLAIREWAGLWIAGPRYRVGDRLMLFLYPPSKLGLTSPVANAGRFSVDHNGWLQLSPGQQQLFNEGKFQRRIPVRGNRIAVRDVTQTLRRAAQE